MTKEKTGANHDLSQASFKRTRKLVIQITDLGGEPLGELHIIDAALLEAIGRRAGAIWNINRAFPDATDVVPRWFLILEKYFRDHIGDVVSLSSGSLLDEANEYSIAEIERVFNHLMFFPSDPIPQQAPGPRDEITRPLLRRLKRAMKKRINVPGSGRPAGRKSRLDPEEIERRKTDHYKQISQAMVTLLSRDGRENDLVTKKLVASEIKKDPKTLDAWLGGNQAARKRTFETLVRQAEREVRGPLEDRE